MTHPTAASLATDSAEIHSCAECGAPAIVGFGEKPRWLCQQHFDEAMARVGQITRIVREATEAFYG